MPIPIIVGLCASFSTNLRLILIIELTYPIQMYTDQFLKFKLFIPSHIITFPLLMLVWKVLFAGENLHPCRYCAKSVLDLLQAII